jgi:hypothetical protein
MRMLFMLMVGFLLGTSSNELEAFSIEDVTNFHDLIVNETKDRLQDAAVLPKSPIELSIDLTPSYLEQSVRVSSTPIPPILGYAPIVIVNNTGLDPSRLYFLGTGETSEGKSHFLKPNRRTGVCSYASPEISNSVDRNISIQLSSLPTDGKGAYFIYVPQQNLGRCYISVDRPLYLQTAEDKIGFLASADFKDPNYNTLYQSFELTLDSSSDLYANISNTDYFSLPMGLSSFTYPTGNPYPTLDNVIGVGFSLETSRQAVLSSLIEEYSSKGQDLEKVIIPFYKEPYSDLESFTDLRILLSSNIKGTEGSLHVNMQEDGVVNPNNPYFELVLGPIDTGIPNPAVAFGPYNLKVNPISQTAKSVSVIYSKSAGNGPNVIQRVSQSGSSVTLNSLYNEFWVKFDSTDGSSTIYIVYPKHQLVVPKSAKYSIEDAAVIRDILFSDVNGESLEFTLSLPSL